MELKELVDKTMGIFEVDDIGKLGDKLKGVCLNNDLYEWLEWLNDGIE